MLAHSHKALRPGTGLTAAILFITLPLSGVPQLAAASDVTPAQAASSRKPTQDRAKALLSSDPGEAADILSSDAKKSQDPVLYIDAAEAYKAAGVADRDKAAVEAAIEHASIGLDILHFQQDPRCDPQWQHVGSTEFDREISRARKVIADSEQALRDLDKPVEEAPPPPDDTDKKTPRDGRGLIAAGSLLTVVGVGGLGMIGAGIALSAKAQKEVEALDPSSLTYDQDVYDLDKKGKGANVIAYAGIGVAAVGLIAGATLLALGVKKRKKYRSENPSDETALHVAPALGRGFAGLSLGGRF